MRAPVNPGEHFGLSEIGPVELTGRVRPCPELDHHRARWSLVVAPRTEALGCELPEGRGHEDPEPPIGGLMHDLSSGVPGAGSTITVARLMAPPRRRTASVLTVLAGMAFLIQVVLVDVLRGSRSPDG